MYAQKDYGCYYKTEEDMNKISDSIVDALHQFHILYIEAIKAHDLNCLISLYTDDCIMIPPLAEPVSGRREIIKFMHKQFEESKEYEISEYDQKFEEVRIFDEWAYEWGIFKGIFHIRNGSPDIFDSSRVFRILRLQPDGSWKVARVIWQYL